MKRILWLILIAFVTVPRPAKAIQILETERTQAGVVVSDTVTVGITGPQLALGPIAGFFVNLILFPFTGPLPEITLFEFDLPGDPAIAPDRQSAEWVLVTPITSPTTITGHLDVDFHALFPSGAEATYGLSSLNASLHPIETVQFNLAAPVAIPEPSMIAPSVCILLLIVAAGRILRAKRAWAVRG
jgi:hypothetical protein